MALPQKVIEQLGREPSRTPGWAGQILMFSGTIFFISLVIYFGLNFGYKTYLNSTVKKLQDQVATFSQQISVEDQKKIISFYSQISNLKTALTNHVFSSQLFSWLEKNTQVNVFFDKFNLNVANNQLSLSGVAKTMDDVNQQLVIFQSQENVSKLALGSVNFTGGIWRFETVLSFHPGYFSRAMSVGPKAPSASPSQGGLQ